MRINKRISESKHNSAMTQKMYDHLRDETFSEYFLEMAEEEKPLTEEKIKRRLSEDLYVLYEMLGTADRYVFLQVVKSGLLVLFMRNDLVKMYVGLMIINVQHEQEKAGESPFVLVTPELLKYLTRVAFDFSYKKDGPKEYRDALRKEVEQIVSNNKEIFRNLQDIGTGTKEHRS